MPEAGQGGEPSEPSPAIELEQDVPPGLETCSDRTIRQADVNRPLELVPGHRPIGVYLQILEREPARSIARAAPTLGASAHRAVTIDPDLEP